MNNRIAPYYKAVVGGLTSGLSYAIPIVDDGLAPSEALGIALAFLVGLGAVGVVPNMAKTKAAGNYEARHGKA